MSTFGAKHRRVLRRWQVQVVDLITGDCFVVTSAIRVFFLFIIVIYNIYIKFGIQFKVFSFLDSRFKIQDSDSRFKMVYLTNE